MVHLLLPPAISKDLLPNYEKHITRKHVLALLENDLLLILKLFAQTKPLY